MKCPQCRTEQPKRWCAGYLFRSSKGRPIYSYCHEDDQYTPAGWSCLRRGCLLYTEAQATRAALKHKKETFPRSDHIIPFIVRYDQPIKERVEL